MDTTRTVRTNLTPTATVVDRWTFTYYPRSGGLIVTTGLTVVDAGVIGNPGAIDQESLQRIARHWVRWRNHYEQVKDRQERARQNRGETVGRGEKHNRPAKGVDR